MRLVLGDDHLMFLEALRAGLEGRGHQVLGCAETLDGLPDLVAELHPDLCLLDVDFRDRSSLPEAAEIKRRCPEIAVVLLTGSATDEAWTAYEDRVVDGLVNKLCDLAVVDRSIRRVAEGERVRERFVRTLPRSGRSPLDQLQLSPRELGVLELLMAGTSTEQIAAELDISVHTARTHIQSILRKFGLTSRAKVVQVAHQLGIGGRTPVR